MDEKPRQLISERHEPVPAAQDSSGARRLRVPTPRKLQCVHGDRTLGQAAHEQGDRAQNQNRLSAFPQRDRRPPPSAREDHAGDGQPEHLTAPAPSTRPFHQPRPRPCGTASKSSTRQSTAVGSTSAEVELNVMTGQCLNRRIDSLKILHEEVAAWEASRDRMAGQGNWQFTTDEARVKGSDAMSERTKLIPRSCVFVAPEEIVTTVEVEHPATLGRRASGRASPDATIVKGCPSRYALETCDTFADGYALLLPQGRRFAHLGSVGRRYRWRRTNRE